MIKKIIFLVFSCLFLGFVYYMIVKENDIKEVVHKKGKSVPGKITDSGGGDLDFEFYIGNTLIKKTISEPFTYLHNEELYKVYYCDSLPGEYFYAFDEPIIERFNYDSTQITNSQIKDERIFFKYKVRDVEYRRFQKISNNKIMNNKTNMVLYKKDHPEIAYLLN